MIAIVMMAETLFKFAFWFFVVVGVGSHVLSMLRNHWATRPAGPRVEPPNALEPGIFEQPAVGPEAEGKPPSEPRAPPKQGSRESGAAATQSWVGTMEYARMEKRDIGEKKIKDFCLAINRGGAILQLWGTDLQRATSDANAKPGDKVRVNFMGYEQVPIRKRDKEGNEKTKMVKKKLYTVAVIT